jgi:2-amino-4-hydroxy-6-hydroxymethyldihydropteridine diphosphokinase
VVLVADAVDPPVWLARAQALERAAERQRDPDRRFGPRTLDVDVIAVWSDDGVAILSDDPELTLPHPRAHLRAFVLRPWLDVQPYAQLPGHGWVFDLVRTAAVAGDIGALAARPELDLTDRL